MQLEAMDCSESAPEHNEVTSRLVKELRDKFVKAQGNSSVLAGERFDAVLEKLQSLGCDKGACAPTKKDVWEVYVLMQYGPNSPHLTGEPAEGSAMGDDFDFDPVEEARLEEDMEKCLMLGSCDPVEARARMNAESADLMGGTSFLQTAGFLSLVANVLVFILILVLVMLFWPIIWWLLFVWLLAWLIFWPISLMRGPRVVHVEPNVYQGPYGYLVDVYGRPYVDARTGWPVMSGFRPVKPAPPLVKYVISGGKPVLDHGTGWPLAIFENGQMAPFTGVPMPYSQWAASGYRY